MEGLLHDCLYPILLGSDTLCHNCVRQLKKRYDVGCVVLTGKRALTLRILPYVRLVEASADLPDDILFSLVCDVGAEGGYRIPLLVLCDEAYRGFFERNRARLDPLFILRTASSLLGEAGEVAY